MRRCLATKSWKDLAIGDQRVALQCLVNDNADA
jgi:hypothetical protein